MLLTSEQERSFSALMKDCGFDSESPRLTMHNNDQQVINVARAVYQAQQDVIDSLHRKIDRYLQARDELEQEGGRG